MGVVDEIHESKELEGNGRGNHRFGAYSRRHWTFKMLCCNKFRGARFQNGSDYGTTFLSKDTTDVEYRILSFKKEFLDCEVIPMKFASGCS